MDARGNQSYVCPITIGRRREHAAIIGGLMQVDTGVILLSGEAGIGKSRLVHNLIEDLAVRGHRVVQGACFEADSAHPFAPLRDLLQALLAEHSPANLANMAGPYASVLCRLLPDFAADGPPSSSPPDKRDLHDALERVLSGIARQAPLVVVLEDLHWSDAASLEFLLFLARKSTGRALSLLCTYRHDEVGPDLRHVLAALDRERLAFDVLLRGLSSAEIDLMLRAIFRQTRSAPAELLHLLTTLTDGNPFFIEEVLSALGMTGAERTPDGFVRIDDADRLPIPRSVQDAVHRRIAQLSPDAREVLALGAVVGRRFSFGLLADLANLDDADLVAALTELVGAQLILEESAEHFSFRHALTRQAVYADLLVRARQGLHQRVGEMLERTVGDDETRRADLAYHFFTAANWEKALDYAWQSGTHAMTLHAPAAAVTHFSRALNAADLMNREPDPALLCARGAAYEQVGEFEHALADYEAARVLARSIGRPLVEVEALLSLGLLWAARDYARAGEVIEQALVVARRLGNDPIVARCLNRLGNWYLNSEHPADALRCHMEALAIADAVGTPCDIAETLDLLGLTKYFLGDLEHGERYLRRAVEHWRRLDDRRGLASSLILLTMSAPTYHTDTVASFATHDAVQTSLEEAVAITREIGWKAGESWGLWIMNGMNLGAQGAYARAIPGIRQAIALAEEIEHVQWMTAATCMLGNVYADLLAHDQAVEQLALALELAQTTGSSYWIRSAAAWLVSATIRQGDMTRATAVLVDEMRSHPSMESPAQRLVWRSSAEHALATGEPARALEILDRLVAAAPMQSTPRPIARLEYLRGKAFLDLGDAKAAEFAFRAACDTADKMGTQPLAWRSHRALGLLFRAEMREDLARQSFTLARSIVEDLAGNVPDESLHDGFLAAAEQLFPHDVWRPRRRTTRLAPGGLTTREQEVAMLVAEGQSNRAISEALFITEWTAATHVRNILAKLGMTSRAQIAAWAVEHDLFHTEST